MPSRDFNSLFVVLACGLEVVQLAINPADAVRETRVPEKIAIATRLLQRFIQRFERSRHLALVSL